MKQIFLMLFKLQFEKCEAINKQGQFLSNGKKRGFEISPYLLCTDYNLR